MQTLTSSRASHDRTQLACARSTRRFAAAGARRAPRRRALKRALDLVAATLLLVLTAPLSFVLAPC